MYTPKQENIHFFIIIVLVSAVRFTIQHHKEGEHGVNVFAVKPLARLAEKDDVTMFSRTYVLLTWTINRSLRPLCYREVATPPFLQYWLKIPRYIRRENVRGSSSTGLRIDPSRRLADTVAQHQSVCPTRSEAPFGRAQFPLSYLSSYHVVRANNKGSNTCFLGSIGGSSGGEV